MRLKANDQIAKHERLWEHPDCHPDWTRTSIVQDLQAKQYLKAQDRLKRWYKHCYGLDEDDFRFIEALAEMRNQVSHITPIMGYSNGEPNDGFTQSLLQGHGDVRDFFDADIESLIDAGLVYYPSIDGQTRKRIIYKPYYCISSEALDCIDKRVQGPDIGDKGESVTHSIGCRLVGEYLRRMLTHATGDTTRVEYYSEDLLDSHAIDVVVLKNNPDTQSMEVFAIAEVETGLNREAEVLNDFTKLGQIACPEKYWIAPTRNLCNRMLNVILARDWFDLEPVPEDLPLFSGEGVLRNTNRRLANATFTPGEFNCRTVPHQPVTTVLSYSDLYRILKTQYEPTLFDPPLS